MRVRRATNYGLLNECLRQLKPSMEEEPEGLSWTDKPLHGMYHHQIEEVAEKQTSRKTYLIPEALSGAAARELVGCHFRDLSWSDCEVMSVFLHALLLLYVVLI